MAQPYQQIIQDIQSLRLGEVQHLINALEDALGVSTTIPYPMPVGPRPILPDPEPTEFDVVLTAVGERRVQTIKAVRKALGLGLREARDAVTTLPAVLRDAVPAEVAESLKAEIEAGGGVVEIRPAG